MIDANNIIAAFQKLDIDGQIKQLENNLQLLKKHDAEPEEIAILENGINELRNHKKTLSDAGISK